MFFGKLLAVQGRTAIFDGCKLLKMGVFRKPRCRTGSPNVAARRDARERRSKDGVEKATEGFFNRLKILIAEQYDARLSV
jgi:hypothetical protein